MFETEALWKNKHGSKITAVCFLLLLLEWSFGNIFRTPTCADETVFFCFPAFYFRCVIIFLPFFSPRKPYWSLISFFIVTILRTRSNRHISFLWQQGRNISINLKCWQLSLSLHYFIEAVAQTIPGNKRIILFIQLLAWNQGLLLLFTVL